MKEYPWPRGSEQISAQTLFTSFAFFLCVCRVALARPLSPETWGDLGAWCRSYHSPALSPAPTRRAVAQAEGRSHLHITTPSSHLCSSPSALPRQR